jgi:hypothetical protein
MKRLLLIWIFSASLDGFSQACQHNLPNCKCLRISEPVAKPDTLCESMHLSIRDNGFVIARKALSVRINGICIQHLQSNGRPFPVHYRVGWCEGREALLNQLIKERRLK